MQDRYLAGLRGIPDVFYEAASIGGADGWGKPWHVTVPLMSQIIFFDLINGYAATLAWVLFFIVMELTALVFREIGSRVHCEEAG